MQLLVPAPRVSPHHQQWLLQGGRAASPQLCCQAGGAGTPVPRAGWAQPVPTVCQGLAPPCNLLLEDPGRPEGSSCSAQQSPLVFRAPFRFFCQFDDLSQDTKSWNKLHFGAFEERGVSSVLGHQCRGTGWHVLLYTPNQHRTPLCPCHLPLWPYRPARIQLQLLAKGGL